MKTRICLFLLAVALCCGCRPGGADTDRPLLCVTIEPLRYVAEQVAGRHFEVVTLVPGGSSPETYEPTPRQLLTLSRSRALFLTGYLGFECTRREAMQAQAPHTVFVTLAEGLPLLREEGPAAHRHAVGGAAEHTPHGHAGGVEPHVWTSPRNLRVMARNLCEALCCLDTLHAADFRSNLRRLEQTIAATDDSIRTLLAGGAHRDFLIYHPTLTYFARDYGLRQHAIEHDGKEPSPARLRALVDTCRRHRIGVVFVQQEFDSRNAEAVAAEVGARTVRINPLSYGWHAEMIHIARSLRHE